jgi:3-hydroxyacyl-[acyl-carrier-protein] dehydratase
VGYWQVVSTLSLPLDHAAIARILPHRFPFLLVDRIVEFEPDQRIVGIKNVTSSERFLSPPDARGQRVLPPTVLTEAVAQVGGILILSKPENAGHLIFFRGIERARFGAPARPGDTITIEARVIRLRSRMGVLSGQARVGDRMVVRGTMTFALGPKAEGPAGSDS